MLDEIRGIAGEVIPGPEIHDDFCHDELAGIHCRRARLQQDISGYAAGLCCSAVYGE